MQVYHVWQKNGQQLTWVNGYDHLEEAEARADLYNHQQIFSSIANQVCSDWPAR
jgi:hypothetical protein